MSPQREQQEIFVSDEESDAESETNKVPRHQDKRLPRLGEPTSTCHWQERVTGLLHVGARSNSQPPVGQVCLLMTGKANEDIGQVGVVVRQAPTMVEVAIQAPSGACVISCMKRPSSLIYLEAGLYMVQEDDGSVWIRH